MMGHASTVLVVEEDEKVRETIEGLLREMGYGVFAAANDREARRYLASSAEPPLLVLSRAPQVAKQLRAARSKPTRGR